MYNYCTNRDHVIRARALIVNSRNDSRGVRSITSGSSSTGAAYERNYLNGNIKKSRHRSKRSKSSRKKAHRRWVRHRSRPPRCGESPYRSPRKTSRDSLLDR